MFHKRMTTFQLLFSTFTFFLTGSKHYGDSLQLFNFIDKLLLSIGIYVVCHEIKWL